jgi:hypothetical protein
MELGLTYIFWTKGKDPGGLWWLCSYQFKVRLMWILAHVGIPGNGIVDSIAKNGANSVLYYTSVALRCSFYPQNKSRFLSEWTDGDQSAMDRYETVDYILRNCSLYQVKRPQLKELSLNYLLTWCKILLINYHQLISLLHYSSEAHTHTNI